jgi:precorrin-2 dehydrogenase/sirohydrochlorin ferrochelatase
MKYFPVCLDLKGRVALVVGGGAIAEGKIRQLLSAGAQIRVVSPQLNEALREMQERGDIEYIADEFAEQYLKGAWLVISATNQQTVNEHVARLAEARGLLCNVVDQPALCNFITSSIVERGDLLISISSSGSSPSVAQRVRREISELIGQEYAALLELAAELRTAAKQQLTTYEQRRDVMQAFAESEALQLLRDGRRDAARDMGKRLLADAVRTSQ